MKKEEVFQQCMNQWGIEAQMDMVVEECSELIQAICKIKRHKEKALDNLLEELADVELMLEQMRYYFNGETIDNWKRIKMERLKTRLNVCNK